MTVAHTNCSGFPPANYVVCDGVDLAMVKGCPLGGDVTRLLNINVSAKIRLGDEAVAFGFRNGDKKMKWAWAGFLMGNFVFDIRSLPFKGLLSLVSGEHVISGIQLNGMSGASVANGCGYVGLAHARVESEQFSAVVLPADTIMKCMESNRNKLMT